MNDSHSFQSFREDLQFLSKSFGDGPSPLRANVGPPRHSSMNTSITYRGYLLKRSNMPFSRTSEPATAFPYNSRPVPELSPMRGLLAPGSFGPQAEAGSNFENSISTLSQDFSLISHSRARASAIESHDTSAKKPLEWIEKSAIEKGADAAADFFGISLSTLDPGTTTVEREEKPSQTEIKANMIPSSLMKTPSIRVQNYTLRNGRFKGSFQEPLHRQQSAPTLFSGETIHDSSVHRSPPPQDVIDPRDGHIWRAKYCVLEDGVLYFYRNKLDGESIEAIRERGQDSFQQNLSSNDKRQKASNLKDLSKSPMARHLYDYMDSCESGESSGYIWEKRVVLDCVGSVRSAEHEYGANSFELQGVETDETLNPIDSLVLRARDPADMQEWIFQFHRSLASFVRNIMDVFGSSRDYLGIDLFAPSTRLSKLADQKGQKSHAPLTSRGFPGVSLSHGHGRTTIHRRRQASCRALPSNEEGVLLPSFTLDLESSKVPGMTARMESSPPSEDLKDTGSSLLTSNNKLNSNQRAQQTSSNVNQSNSVQKRKYIPPHLRRKNHYTEIGLTGEKSDFLPSQSGSLRESGFHGSPFIVSDATGGQVQQNLDKGGIAVAQGISQQISRQNVRALPSTCFSEDHVLIKRGGCANPDLIVGSIMDSRYIPRKASRLEKNPEEAFGGWGGNSAAKSSGIYWEVGAVSECGIRDSNEDSFLIVHDLLSSAQLDSADLGCCDVNRDNFPIVGLFAVFDGHCGNEAARFAAEKLCSFIQLEFLAYSDGATSVEFYEQLTYDVVRVLLDKALRKLDSEFCELCQEGGREWESGTTALVSVIVNDLLVAANLGDCRGVVYRTMCVGDSKFRKEDWNELDLVFDDHEKSLNNMSINSCTLHLWREVARVHKPSDEDEMQRIQKANGWVTTETEIPIGQLRRMDFHDENVIEILRSSKEYKAAPQRILEISRVCGELAVSRALGDRDFKASFNTSTGKGANSWECPLFLLFPEQHNHLFRGNLIDNCPDFEHVRVGSPGSSEEFLVMASDGLWDVLDVDDAVRVTRDLLFRKQWTAKRTAARLAELAIHLGSSDNITVIVVRWQIRRIKDNLQE